MKILLYYIIIGGLFIITNPDVGKWKFPLAMTQEWREFFRLAGWALILAGYPISFVTRSLFYLIGKIKK